MISVKKEITVVISGDDVQTLTSICDCARIYMEGHTSGYNWKRGEKGIGQFSKEEVNAISLFLNHIFDGV